MKVLPIAPLVVRLGFIAPAQGVVIAEDLIKQVLAGFETNDQSALSHLTLNEAEYEAYVRPKVSANNPGAKLTKFYTLYRQISNGGLTEGLKRYGGRRLQLVKLKLGPAISQGKHYRLLSAAVVTVRDSDGIEKRIRPVGALLEHDGAFKVSTYFVTPKADTK